MKWNNRKQNDTEWVEQQLWYQSTMVYIVPIEGFSSSTMHHEYSNTKLSYCNNSSCPPIAPPSPCCHSLEGTEMCVFWVVKMLMQNLSPEEKLCTNCTRPYRKNSQSSFNEFSKIQKLPILMTAKRDYHKYGELLYLWKFHWKFFL